MKITIFGAGHVGLVEAAVLAKFGHNVLCIDMDNNKINNLKNGILPFYEPGLSSLIHSVYNSGKLKFTVDARLAVQHGDIQCIAVGTPLNQDGHINLQYVMQVASTIAKYMNNYKLILNKSTVPVGTTEKIKFVIYNILRKRDFKLSFDIVYNPEFMREGSAIFDCTYPDRFVFGYDNKSIISVLLKLFKLHKHRRECVIFMDIRSAELTKFAANCMLATKISFINELANLSEALGADITHVCKGISTDHRIGSFFIRPGCGYGGSCFFKDIKYLVYIAKRFSYTAKLLQAVQTVNEYQKNKILKFIDIHYKGNLFNKIFAIWGLSFKPETDDIREASSLVIIKYLLKVGAKVQAYDPKAMTKIRDFFGQSTNLFLMQNKEDALHNADALIICTEWKDFYFPDFTTIKILLKTPVIFDGRNLYSYEYLSRFGFVYYSIGRGK